MRLATSAPSSAATASGAGQRMEVRRSSFCIADSTRRSSSRLVKRPTSHPSFESSTPRALDAPPSGRRGRLPPAYDPFRTSPMWRMVVERSSFRPARTDDVIALDESWLEAVTALAEEGHRHGEGPTFFQPSMLGRARFVESVKGRISSPSPARTCSRPASAYVQSATSTRIAIVAGAGSTHA